jgi:transcriptional regulator with XRE-family HTH domain
MGHWSGIVRAVRTRAGFSQQQLADRLNVSQRTVSRWERGDDNPSIAQQKRLRELGWQPPGSMLRSLVSAVQMCPVPRALSRTPRLQLLAVSKPALEKRPVLADWIGKELIGQAGGVLKNMLDDRQLQRSIARQEIAGIVATTHSVLEMPGPPVVAAFKTTITYFWHEGTLYSDAISQPTAPDTACGYDAIPMEEMLPDEMLPFVDQVGRTAAEAVRAG